MMSVEKFIQIERSRRRVLLIALAAIVVFGLYRWILAPHANQLMAAQKYNFSLDVAIHKADLMRTDMENKKTKIAELTKESDRLRNQLFTQNEARRFFASLPSVAAQSGCAVLSVSAVSDAQRNTQNDTPAIAPKKAMVTIVGGYNGITKFIGVLQNYERKVWIESVRIDAGGAGKLKCQVLLTVYCIERVENSLYE
ncbi:MAG: type 4a pilus biogenesis protein PilO [Sedimentisphaerales bacterium]|jgi:Tfp pilus assembly protein PilO